MFNKGVLFLVFITIYQLSFSQIQKDTTFTVYAEYKKNIKTYPFIQIVKPKHNSNIKVLENIVYKNTGKRNLYLDAFLSKAPKKHPAIFLIHGGGWKSGNKEMNTPMALQLASAGYNVFSLEYRLSDEDQYPSGMEDILEAIQFIIKNQHQYQVNPNKIAVLGCSSGAQMANLIGQKHPEYIKAIVNVDGILAFHHPESKEGKMAAAWLGGSYEEVPQTWEDASPLNHVTIKSPPILFINSQFERFHAGRDDMIKKLNAFGIYSEIQKIENSPHAFWVFDPWFNPTIQYTLQFLNKTLK